MNARLRAGLIFLGITGAVSAAAAAVWRSPPAAAVAPPTAHPEGTAHADPRPTSKASSARASDDDREEPLGPIVFPDVVLTNQRGEPVRLYRDLVKGKRVAMSFLFTRCTTICPPIGMSFSRLERLLGARAGTDVNLVSVTLDPLYDTPERLREFAERYRGGAGWTLLTGDKGDIDAVLKALTVYTAAKEEHAPIVLIGDDVSGSWVRAFGLSSPETLLSILDRAPRAAPAALGAPGQ